MCAVAAVLQLGCGSTGNRDSDRSTKDTTNVNTETTIHPELITYKVFLENSGSMYGFVYGMADFKIAIHELLTGIECNNISDSMNFNYINSKIINSDYNTVNDFITDLTPASGRRDGGNINISDIREMFEMVLDTMNKGDVSIFISDCDFVNKTQGGVALLQSNMQSTFTKKMRDFEELTTLVVYLESSFLHRQKIYQKPYYMWIMGDQNEIVKFIEKTNIKNIKGYKDSHLFFGDISSVESKLCPGKQKDSWKLRPIKRGEQRQQMEIVRAKKGEGAGFGVEVDLSNVVTLVGNQYVLDANNYCHIPGYEIAVKELSNSSKYTHRFDIIYEASKPVRNQDIDIKLKRPVDTIPMWVKDINADKEGTFVKTCGIENMFNGIQAGYGGNINPNLFGISVKVSIGN